MAGPLRRELGRSYPFPVQTLHLNNLPPVPQHETPGGYLPEAFGGATAGQAFGFKPDYGPQGGSGEPYPGGGEVPRTWYPFAAGADAWGHPPGIVVGPYALTQPGEACQASKAEIKVERDFDQAGPYYGGHPWVGSCLVPAATVTAPARPASCNNKEDASPSPDREPSSSPASPPEEVGSGESSPRSVASQSPSEQMASEEAKDEEGSGEEVGLVGGEMMWAHLRFLQGASQSKSYKIKK